MRMDIFNVVCPACRKKYYADMLLYSLDVELHCPYCDVYFRRTESPQVFVGGTAASAVVRVAGGLSKDMIYRPKREEEK
jgi:hypothetical protein